MAKRYTITVTALLILVALTGCGQPAENNNPAPAGACAWTGERTGLCVAPDPDVTLAIDPARLEIEYEIARQCAADFLDLPAVLETRGPVVRVTAAPFFAGGEWRHGWTDYQLGQITIVPTFYGGDFGLLHHEYLHFLLSRNGLPPGHEHPLFASDCDPTLP